ncbi:MAG: phosphodiester glycosidase family protein, partial [Kiritimatiellae bacterium]|nr:phosphodiester glycosidase family protein [Kiritimatiellia bacterium]
MKQHASFLAFCALAVQTASLHAAVSDFTRTAVPNWNGREGVTFVRYVSKDSGKVYGSAFAFDLSKGYRLKAWLGASNTPGCAPAAVGAMAEAIFAEGGVAPVAGVNGDYFDTSASYARPTGLVISDSDLVSTGFGRASLTANCYLAETGDHNLHHGKLDCVEGLAYGGQPAASWQLNARSRKVRNAIRTNYCNYPVKAGAINPVGSSSGESAFATTIGNMQSRNYYYRTLVGIGTNDVGVATNLVLFSNTVYNGIFGIGDSPFADVDAYQIMIDLGCNEVGELDGGGSATIWSESCTTLQNFFKGGTTAHGGYVNEYRDSSPRAVACGIFVMPPSETPDAVALNGANTYPGMEEALLAAVPGDTLSTLGDAPRTAAVVTNAATRVALEWNPELRFGAIPWFSAEAATGATAGGAWLSAPVRVLQGA